MPAFASFDDVLAGLLGHDLGLQRLQSIASGGAGSWLRLVEQHDEMVPTAAGPPPQVPGQMRFWTFQPDGTGGGRLRWAAVELTDLTALGASQRVWSELPTVLPPLVGPGSGSVVDPDQLRRNLGVLDAASDHFGTERAVSSHEARTATEDLAFTGRAARTAAASVDRASGGLDGVRAQFLAWVDAAQRAVEAADGLDRGLDLTAESVAGPWGTPGDAVRRVLESTSLTWQGAGASGVRSGSVTGSDIGATDTRRMVISSPEWPDTQPLDVFAVGTWETVDRLTREAWARHVKDLLQPLVDAANAYDTALRAAAGLPGVEAAGRPGGADGRRAGAAGEQGGPALTPGVGPTVVSGLGEPGAGASGAASGGGGGSAAGGAGDGGAGTGSSVAGGPGGEAVGASGEVPVPAGAGGVGAPGIARARGRAGPTGAGTAGPGVRGTGGRPAGSGAGVDADEPGPAGAGPTGVPASGGPDVPGRTGAEPVGGSGVVGRPRADDLSRATPAASAGGSAGQSEGRPAPVGSEGTAGADELLGASPAGAPGAEGDSSGGRARSSGAGGSVLGREAGEAAGATSFGGLEPEQLAVLSSAWRPGDDPLSAGARRAPAAAGLPAVGADDLGELTPAQLQVVQETGRLDTVPLSTQDLAAARGTDAGGREVDASGTGRRRDDDVLGTLPPLGTWTSGSSAPDVGGVPALVPAGVGDADLEHEVRLPRAAGGTTGGLLVGGLLAAGDTSVGAVGAPTGTSAAAQHGGPGHPPLMGAPGAAGGRGRRPVERERDGRHEEVDEDVAAGRLVAVVGRRAAVPSRPSVPREAAPPQQVADLLDEEVVRADRAVGR